MDPNTDITFSARASCNTEFIETPFFKSREQPPLEKAYFNRKGLAQQKGPTLGKETEICGAWITLVRGGSQQKYCQQQLCFGLTLTWGALVRLCTPIASRQKIAKQQRSRRGKSSMPVLVRGRMRP